MTRRLSALLLTALVIASALSARTVRTTRRAPRAVTSVDPAPTSPVADTIIPGKGEIIFSRYDKPLRSTTESYFITNNTTRHIVSAVVTTDYYDLGGNRIHRASRHISLPLAPGETTAVNHRSWDRQRSFYYIGSRRPRVQATPYDVRLHADTIFVSPLSTPADGPSD